MPPATLAIILQGIMSLITAAPQVVEIVKAAKDLFSAMFAGNLITKAQQDALHAWVDAHAALVQSGITPPAWTVEPDPVTPTPSQVVAPDPTVTTTTTTKVTPPTV